MSDTKLSRRAFLHKTTTAASTSLIALSLPMIMSASQQARAAQAMDAPLTALQPDEALELAAIAARIIPTDETPGATEAGAVYFMDRVLSTSHANVLPELRTGLATLQATASTRYGSANFHTLAAGQQDALLQDIEDSSFFNTLRFLTIAGTFSLPQYGGNRDHIGWKLIGFEDRHMWQPPFGYYDADYAAKGE
ncbi:MAG: gluconate 2-dehydrogenase subunit 3 family protein [Pseudomonadales bacterium]|nr:gluconate 2-dehydrogenase subunit 3 family protein [Pseudomonadales bacterium]